MLTGVKLGRASFDVDRSATMIPLKPKYWLARMDWVVVSALIMSFQMAIGGANETAATTLFALVFLFALTKAFLHIRRREIAQHREWMIRAFAVGLAVATVRPIMGLFFAFSRITHQTPRE